MSIKLLVQHLEADLEPALNNMIKVNAICILQSKYIIVIIITIMKFLKKLFS